MKLVQGTSEALWSNQESPCAGPSRRPGMLHTLDAWPAAE